MAGGPQEDYHPGGSKSFGIQTHGLCSSVVNEIKVSFLNLLVPGRMIPQQRMKWREIEEKSNEGTLTQVQVCQGKKEVVSCQ